VTSLSASQVAAQETYAGTSRNVSDVLTWVTANHIGDLKSMPLSDAEQKAIDEQAAWFSNAQSYISRKACNGVQRGTPLKY
jgi:hypothetical protein